MTAPERHHRFDQARAAALPTSFVPARVHRDRWAKARRLALIAAATLGLWMLLLAPGGRALG